MKLRVRVKKEMGKMLKWGFAVLAALFFWMQGSEGKWSRSWGADNIFHAYVGQTRAPDFSLRDLQGKTVSLADLKGKVVLFNFWATWCQNCRKEGSSFNTLFNRYRSQDFILYRVNTKEGRETVQKYVEKESVQVPVLLDEKGKVGRLFGVWANPTTYLIDRGGNVRYRSIGAVDWAGPEPIRVIDQLLQEK